MLSISNNIMALNAQRQLNMVGKNKSKSMEKLSSGYKINRAADDAAGLSISEKMRKQIKALNQGTDNIQDGISLCNVADGALEEIHTMLQRENVLLIKAANGTNSNSDRQAIQNEIDQISGEMDRIFETTEFNTIKIFKGGKIGNKSRTNDDIVWVDKGSVPLDPSYVPLSKTSKTYLDLINLKSPKSGDFSNIAGNIDVAGWQSIFLIDNDSYIYQLEVGGMEPYTDIPMSDYLVNSTSNPLQYTAKYMLPSGLEFTQNIRLENNSYIFDFSIKNNGSSKYDRGNWADYLVGSLNHDNWKEFAEVEYTVIDPDNTLLSEVDDNEGWHQMYTSKELLPGESYTVSIGAKINLLKDPYIKESKDEDQYKNIVIQTNDEPDTSQQISIKLFDLSTDKLNLVSGTNVSAFAFDNSLINIKEGMDEISSIRSYYGATTNRLMHAYNNISNIAENTQAAESCIRDSDMAKEMVLLARQNILEQAGISVLSQANFNNDGILKLLG